VLPTRWVLALATLLALPLAAHAADAPDRTTDTLIVRHPEIVVSATRTPRNAVNVPQQTAVITRDDLRRRSVHTLAEALQDLAGIDVGEGSDNGSRLPNVGMWGLKEFDALLFTLNGVPVGGPFNPSLAQIPVEDLDRIEVVKGPQGTMYGVSAFAGMIQAFTPEAIKGGELSAGGGSFSQGFGHFSWGRPLASDRSLLVSGSFGRSGGWQDRTEGDYERGYATFTTPLGRGRLALDVNAVRDAQDWGSPLPFDSGELLPGFVIDRNYAVGGAEVKHQVIGGAARLTWPLREGHRIENTLSWTHDEQDFLRSFPGEIAGDTLNSEGLELEPKETSLYEDLRMVSRFRAGGDHELVAGGSVTWGETKGEGREFDFDQLMSAYPDIPDADAITDGEDREFEDRRTFFGVYLHDAWTPTYRLTLEGGGRFDATSEELETEADLPSGPTPVHDEKEDSDFSGDLSALFRLLPPEGSGTLDVANLYASVRRSFKPAAPNLAEAEAAEILDPEHTTSWEVGLKTRALDSALDWDVAYFDMTFEDMVVSILGAGGGPELTNAGKQRFKGVETQLRWAPPALPGTVVSIGYAHHDAKFVDFTFVTPDSQLRDVGGKRLELVPQDQVNGRLSVRTASGLGGFVAGRWQGERPFNRRNTAFAEAYTEWDAGASYDHDRWRLSVVGRNLGDDRHVVTESEIGDSQFYVAPPRRFTAELGIRF
jgi:outer membrane receptor protein involved in Fe transport